MPDAVNKVFGGDAFLALSEGEAPPHLFGKPGAGEIPVMAAE